VIVIPEIDAVTLGSTWNTRLFPPASTVTPLFGPVIVVAPVVSVSSSWVPLRVIVFGVFRSVLAGPDQVRRGDNSRQGIFQGFELHGLVHVLGARFAARATSTEPPAESPDAELARLKERVAELEAQKRPDDRFKEA
jgi:hypothetical protein